ncbi:MAG: sodium:solute symporter family protein [bacterium]|nr:sodium:solute symporter family protein [bacterium]
MFAAVVITYFVIMICVGAYLSRRIKFTSDFLIAGRNLGLILSTATLAAVQIGAGVILGGAELGAESGIWPGMWYGLGCGGGLILTGLLVASKLRKRGGFVPLDFFSERYGERKYVRIWGWLSNIPSLLGIFIAQLIAAGSLLSIFGLSYNQGILIVGTVILLYSITGGMWGVVVTDFIQLCIIVVGIPLVAIVVMMKIGDPGVIAGVFSAPFIPPKMFSRAIFIIVPFLLSISVSYDAFMRYQSARSDMIAKWGCILGGIIVILISFCAGLIGAAGKIVYPDIANGEVLPHVIRTAFSPLVTGFLVSALLAAIMSSANSLLISLSGCFTRDLYNKVLNPDVELDKLKNSKLFSRLVIAGCFLVGIIVAFRAEGILYTIIIFNYPYMGSMLVPLLGGVLWKGATAKGAIAAMITGGCIGVVSFIAGMPGPQNALFNIDLGLIFAYTLSAVVFIAVSLYTSEEKLHNA